MPATLSFGSKGPEVALLQLQLNLKGATPLLGVDGDFGSKTKTAVVAFQRAGQLTADGIVGSKTHAALSKGLNLTTITHNIGLIPQPTATTCWAASTAMMTKSTVAAVKAKTPQVMWSDQAGLFNASETDQAVTSGAAYGRVHGLRCHAPMSWSSAGLLTALRRSPLMIDMLWKSDEYVQGKGSPGHMVVISAAVSDGGAGTFLLVLDPWKPGVGKYTWVDYYRWVQEVPTRTYRIFERL